MMKKLLISLLTLGLMPSQLLAKAMLTQDIGVNIYKLATAGQCTGCDLTGLNSSQLKAGATILVQTTKTTVPASAPTPIYSLAGAILSGATFNCAQDGIKFSAGADFSNAQIDNVTFNGCDLTGAKFNNTILTGTSFVGSTLVNVDFSGVDTNLSGANLSGVNATGANFTNVPMYAANLSCGNFTNTRLSGTGLSGAIIACGNPVTCDSNGNCTGGTNFTNALFYDPATGRGLDESINQEDVAKDSSGNYVITLDTTKLNLSGMTLSNVIFNNANMVGIDLSNVLCTNCHFSGANMQSSTDSYTNTANSNTIATITNLSNANLSYAVLNNANLSGANLTGANLSCANLINANVQNVSGTPSNINGINYSCDLTAGKCGARPNVLLGPNVFAIEFNTTPTTWMTSYTIVTQALIEDRLRPTLNACASGGAQWAKQWISVLNSQLAPTLVNSSKGLWWETK